MRCHGAAEWGAGPITFRAVTPLCCCRQWPAVYTAAIIFWIDWRLTPSSRAMSAWLYPTARSRSIRARRWQESSRARRTCSSASSRLRLADWTDRKQACRVMNALLLVLAFIAVIGGFAYFAWMTAAAARRQTRGQPRKQPSAAAWVVFAVFGIAALVTAIVNLNSR